MWKHKPLLAALASLLFCGCAGLEIEPDRIYVDEPTKAYQFISRPGVYIIDVSPADEFEARHIEGANSIPYSQLWGRMGFLPEDQSHPILVYDRLDRRAAPACYMIRQDGYFNVHELRGGLKAWQEAGLPVVP